MCIRSFGLISIIQVTVYNKIKNNQNNFNKNTVYKIKLYILFWKNIIKITIMQF